MKGRHSVEIRNNRSVFKFNLEYNISVIKGDSATGKTTLIDMISEYQRFGESSGITLKCDKKCIVLDSFNWNVILSTTKDSIVFIEEGNSFVKSQEFAAAIKGTDNYYVIVTRENLFELPISVEAIYGIRGRKYFQLKRTYNSLYRIYPENMPVQMPSLIITEDSGSGYDFWKSVAKDYNYKCFTSKGNANLLNLLKNNEDQSILVIADGAAFGAYMEMLYDYRIQKNREVYAYLPESFEWLILSSDVFGDKEIKQILSSPYDFIDSKKYFSREQFYTALLISKTKDTYLKYSKRKLNKAYLEGKTKTMILKNVPSELFGDK